LLSACFIQGAQLSQVATQLKLPIQTVQQFIAACIISNNGGHYSSNRKSLFEIRSSRTAVEEHNFFNKFFGKIRRRFGL
jgi:hypothetical protein